MLQFFYVIGQIAFLNHLCQIEFLKHLWQPGIHKDLKIYLLLALANSIAHLIAGTASLRCHIVSPKITISFTFCKKWDHTKRVLSGLITHII
ncbi:hypothetical protein DKU39_23175 [Salmonella enterica subsp. houtenae]|nr:hypothetical protein [Salmonella enterica subsp. houtenae]ECI4026692.1 hypothetical protein [Salmonella enterica subsp. houtenae]